MKEFYFILLILFMVVMSCIDAHFNRQLTDEILKSIKQYKPVASDLKLSDGEGNPLPQRAVKLLVMSQYCRMDKKQLDSLDYYFYSVKHVNK